jgi:excinuclease ABC subunit C
MKSVKTQDLLIKAKTLPQLPGCYLMRNKSDEVIYVGKAKKLKNRVTSYFNESTKSAKTQVMVSHVKDFEFIITDSDPESFVLENNLIKEHRPKYNIRMRDDKSYPYAAYKTQDPFAKLEYIRRPKKNQLKEFFGPFPVGFNLSRVLRLLTKAFRLRDCSDHDFKNRSTPCILYQMGQCTAPCVGLINEDDYKKDLKDALKFFGSSRQASSSVNKLKRRMESHAESEEFEKAASMRDLIFELEEFLEQSFKQRVESLDEKNMDVIAYYSGEHEVDISLYTIRNGNLLGHKNFHFSTADYWNELNEEVVLYMLQYYSQYDQILPDTIVLDIDKESRENFQGAINKIVANKKVKVISGKTGKYKSLLQTTLEHAKESQRVRLENEDSVYIGLNQLKHLLNLKDRPRLLECYDVAIWQGKSPTASQIVFYEGKPEKERYRHYHLQERPEGNNDFAMMREVFERRLDKGQLPDVFIVDGGKAQVSTVSKVLEELQIEIPVIGIAKSKDLTGPGRYQKVEKSDERLVIPGRSNPYILKKSPSLFKIIVSMRDEAHRFSRRLHHKAEEKRLIKSWVDEIKGISAEARKLILANSPGPKESLLEFNVKQLQDLLGLNQRTAKTLYEFLRRSSN